MYGRYLRFRFLKWLIDWCHATPGLWATLLRPQLPRFRWVPARKRLAAAVLGTAAPGSGGGPLPSGNLT